MRTQRKRFAKWCGVFFTSLMARFLAITRFVLQAILILLLFACETNLVKIHRAYPRLAKTKFESSTSRTPNNDQNYFPSFCDYLPDLSKIFIKKEAWFYSIPATLLVGMCGIFPLVVIPVESGHALREGGEIFSRCHISELKNRVFS